MLRATVIVVLLYSHECWLLTKEEIRRAEMAENIPYVTTGYGVTSYEYSKDIRELKLRDINPIIKPLKSSR